jgi:hypothetical protein
LDPGNLESDLQAGSIAKYKVIKILIYQSIETFLNILGFKSFMVV